VPVFRRATRIVHDMQLRVSVPDDRRTVCLVLRYFTVGGLERVVSLLANELHDRHHQVRIIVLGVARRNALITELNPGVEVHLLNGPWIQRLVQLKQLTRGHTVHLHFGDGKIHPSVRWALWRHPRVIVTYHSVYSHKRSNMKNRMDRALNWNTKAVVAVSDAVSRFCRDEVRLDPHVIRVIRNAVPKSSPGRVCFGRRDALTLVALASVYPHKNHMPILRGFAGLLASEPNACLRIIGDGPDMATIFQEARLLNIVSAIEWYGAIWRRDIVSALLAGCDALVSASRYEGCPLSVLEGLSAGLPMVLSDIPAHREVAKDAALYFSLDDGDSSLSRQLIRLQDGDLRSRLALAAVQRSEAFSVDAFVNSHVDLYAMLAS
jgi:glycosyltransferase involved in cell wall biosynthesis